MEREAFEVLADIAMSFFDNYHAGLNAFLSTDKKFKKYFEYNERIPAFKKTGEFFISQNERNFHLIGFMDAILWLGRSGYLDFSALTEAAKPDFEEDAEEWLKEMISEATSDKEVIDALFLSAKKSLKD